MAMMQDAAAAAQQDPGKVDVTSPEAAANPGVMGAPVTPEAAFLEAQGATDDTPSAAAGEDEATPEEQAEYEQAMKAVQVVLYDNDRTSEAIADMLQPEDKIGSVVQATLLTLNQIDSQLDMDEAVIPQVMSELADRIMDMGEQAKGMEFSEQEAQAVLGSVWEGVMEMYGVDEEEYNNFTSNMSTDEVASQEQTYKQFLGE